MPLTRGLLRMGALALLLAGAGGAAGVLNTTAPFATSAFCQSYECGLIGQTANGWLYGLNTGDSVLVSRASSSAASRLLAVALLVNNPQARNFASDVQTFSDLQREALGGVAVTGAIGRCYDTVNGHAVLYSFGGGANFRQINCGRVLNGFDGTGGDMLILIVTTLRTDSAPVADSPPAPSGPASSGGAPRFLEWHFAGCTAQGHTTQSLRAGQASGCLLTVETVPNGARPISAEFRYELEYSAGGVKQKLTLDGVDRWSAGGGGAVQFSASGGQLRFSLPLNVRLRPERRYNAINVIGTINFDNGSSKRVYEPLAITQP